MYTTRWELDPTKGHEDQFEKTISTFVFQSCLKEHPRKERIKMIKIINKYKNHITAISAILLALAVLTHVTGYQGLRQGILLAATLIELGYRL
ncbi:hypothetical protein [Virgibacillus sp. L01]|uniref:hypothetical protein n=1 Tax=Virgibacillus sp. L01 TaxID=3457429 RepID=UPI003FD24C2F